MSIRESIISLFGPKEAAARLADLETKHSVASENMSTARAAFAEASLSVEAGLQGADRQLAKARDALTTAEARLAELEGARSVARRATEEAAGLAEAEGVAERWAELEQHIGAIRSAGQEIEDLVERLGETQGRVVAAAEAARRAVPIAGETRDAISPERLDALIRLALFKGGFPWALRTGLTAFQAPSYAEELDAALSAFTKYAPGRDDARAA